MNFASMGVVSVPASDFVYKKEDNWCNYPKGVHMGLPGGGISGDQRIGHSVLREHSQRIRSVFFGFHRGGDGRDLEGISSVSIRTW